MSPENANVVDANVRHVTMIRALSHWSSLTPVSPYIGLKGPRHDAAIAQCEIVYCQTAMFDMCLFRHSIYYI